LLVLQHAGKARPRQGRRFDMDAIIVIAIFVIGFAVLNLKEYGRVD
jgi:hypothetical protein